MMCHLHFGSLIHVVYGYYNSNSSEADFWTEYAGIGVCWYANEITLDIGKSLCGVLMIVVRAELRMVCSVWVRTLNMELS